MIALSPGDGRALLLAGLGLAAGAATLVGGGLALRYARRLHLLLGFSAGAVIGVALLDLLPEAMRLNAGGADRAAWAIAAAFVAYLVVDRIVLINAGAGRGHRGHFGAASLTAHSLMDGIGIGLGFQVSTATGAVLAIAVLAHDLADGINTVNLSLAGGGPSRIARRWLIADALAPMAGISLSQLVRLRAGDLALAVAAFTGFFLYIGATELIPESHQRAPSAWTTATTVAGAAFIALVMRVASGLSGG
ncbi:MAG: hypothetical protein JOZ27_01210 [Caulobacteraceae bacterium]|nr:hypothetical protein [Caulobacteraceae bacterium]